MNTLLLIVQFFGVSIEVYFIFMILAIPMFFLWKWIFKGYFKNDKKRKVGSLIATLIVTPIIYFVIVFLTIMSWCYYPESDFDKQKWIMNKETRYELSEDIIDSKMLIGKTKTEVRQLLGDEGNSNESDLWSAGGSSQAKGKDIILEPYKRK
jgi:hypothetical protein